MWDAHPPALTRGAGPPSLDAHPAALAGLPEAEKPTPCFCTEALLSTGSVASGQVIGQVRAGFVTGSLLELPLPFVLLLLGV